ncbi:radical SAM protein [Helicobacter sp. MIT 11-5569]|uniref:radical SAM protein n=1 Tax=Helicobacter sp. MIT 11-5569 TaxID=1548151 RepID=UPI00051FB741|nr:radical SAM protein [Helicobacter sp. MIT 11-5569]TLD81360.1 radical SAM protein [Helicobacter sp. MIT 11-5569]
MTPPILKELFDQWRKEGLSFCVTSENYNKSSKFEKEFFYPYGELVTSNDYWEEKSSCWGGEIPATLEKELIERIALHILKYAKPKSIYLQVTSRCNYACPMCPFHGEGYNGKYFNDNPSLKPQDMPLDEAKLYIDKMADYGIEMISMSSEGEFFLYPYWEEVSRYIKKRGMRVSTTTNGSLVTEEVVQKLKDIGFDEMRFSIDSVRKDTYSYVRSSNDKFYQTAINAPALTTEAGIYTAVHFVQQNKNIEEKEEVLSFFKSKNVNAITTDVERFHDGIKNESVMPIERLDYIHGLCGAYDYAIMVDGNFLSCCGMGDRYKYIKKKLDKFSLKDHSFDEVVKYNHNLLINKDKEMMSLCYHCDLFSACFKSITKRYLQEKYFVINYGIREHHFRVPKEISFLSDDIIFWMYENNVVSKMKQDGLIK